jgi:hypothetical protein
VRAPAAGRAGGRAARTTGVLSAALAAGLLTVGPAGTTPAWATGPIAAVPPLTAAPAADPDRPVQISVGRLEPRTVTDGSRIQVSGTLTNTGATPIRDIIVRLQRGDVMTTRAELVAKDADPDQSDTAVGPWTPVRGILAPGEELPFSYAIDAEDLFLTEDGVYPLLVNVNATTDDGVASRVGELSTYLVRRPAIPDEKTTVAWLWPITAHSSRSPAGGFANDDLARSVSPGGRLDEALAVIERLPGNREGSEERPLLPVTLAIDPALVEELGIMAEGPYTVGRDDTPGQGTDAAAAYLDRLRALAAVHPVVALPYGDVDADALESVGLDDVLTRSLPGTAAGTAQGTGAPVPAPQTEVEPTTPAAEPTDDGTAAPTDESTEATPTGTTATGTAATPGAGEETTGAGARILADVLDVEPRTDLAWSVGGSFRADSVAALRAGGVHTLVLGPVGVTRGDRAVGLRPGTARAGAEVSTDDGELPVLVADTGLGTVVDGAEDWPGGPRVAHQRYLAELALIGQQAPGGSSATVLVAPSREVEAGPEGAGAMMADTAGLPWLEPSSLTGLEDNEPFDAGRLAKAGPVALDPDGLADVVAAERSRDDLAGAVVGDPDEVLRSYDAATARTVSVTHQDDAAGFRRDASTLRTAVGRLLDRVSLLAPADGTYSLASRDAPLPLTVQNELPFAVSVQVDLSTPNTRSIRIGDIGVQTLAPGERTTLEVPTEVRQAGRFIVRAALRTPDGAALGDPVRLQVRSTEYGTISLVITFGAAGLLGLLFLRRLVNFVLRRRRVVPAPAPAGAPEGAAVPMPPTRSPV